MWNKIIDMLIPQRSLRENLPQTLMQLEQQRDGLMEQYQDFEGQYFRCCEKLKQERQNISGTSLQLENERIRVATKTQEIKSKLEKVEAELKEINERLKDLPTKPDILGNFKSLSLAIKTDKALHILIWSLRLAALFWLTAYFVAEKSNFSQSTQSGMCQAG